MSRTQRRVVIPGEQDILADDHASRTRRVRVLAKLLDNSISIPGTGWKIGFDPIIGLIPGIGDLIGAVMSGYIILEAARAEIPTLTLARMLGNVGIDTLLGAIPIIGAIPDLFFRSNSRNLRIVKRWLDKHHPETMIVEGEVVAKPEGSKLEPIRGEIVG